MWMWVCECVNTDANLAYLALQDPRLLNDQQKQTSKQGQTGLLHVLHVLLQGWGLHAHTHTGWASGDGHRQRRQQDCRTADQLKKGEGRQETKTENRQTQKTQTEQSDRTKRLAEQDMPQNGREDEQTDERTRARAREETGRREAKYIKLKTYLHLLLGFARVSQGAASKRRSGGKLKQVDK